MLNIQNLGDQSKKAQRSKIYLYEVLKEFKYQMAFNSFEIAYKYTRNSPSKVLYQVCSTNYLNFEYWTFHQK